MGRAETISHREPTTRIALVALNARYIHCAFGLRYLQANLGPLQADSGILEFTIQDRAVDIVERILAVGPCIVGIGVYVWNAELALEVVTVLKQIAPEVHIVLGGPEVSHETHVQDIVTRADAVVTGEGEITFRTLCERLLYGKPLLQKVHPGVPPDINTLKLPYALYSADDIQHRIVYVEASRGCPFRCQFCLSSLDKTVRQFPLEDFFEAMENLYARGVRHFKFVDRTFNLRPEVSQRILKFFLQRYTPGLFVHFEMIPDRLPEELKTLIVQFPPAALQFEIGIQTFNPDIAARIGRRQDNAKAEENIRFLREHTGVHLHTDLILGLPGEDLTSIGQGFDRLLALDPQEIQVGVLKRLRGAPIAQHTKEFEMVYNTRAPYEILKNRDLDFDMLQELSRMARVFDAVNNSGQFVETAKLLAKEPSPFQTYRGLSAWLYAKEGRVHAMAVERLAVLLYDYIQTTNSADAKRAEVALRIDASRNSRRPPPNCIAGEHVVAAHLTEVPEGTPKRQAKHLRAGRSGGSTN